MNRGQEVRGQNNSLCQAEFSGFDLSEKYRM